MVTRGSVWHRWEPHIHGPGTVLNNQFGGTDPWDSYLTALESAEPTIEALAVTDYYTTDTYEEAVRRKDAGRLPNVKLLFPNIEVRLDVAAKSGFVNLHLLVSPEDPNHVGEIRRFLSRLHFVAHGDTFDCTSDDLIRLGKAADPPKTEDRVPGSGLCGAHRQHDRPCRETFRLHQAVSVRQADASDQLEATS